MSLNVIAWVLEFSPTVGTDKVVLLTLADRAHHDGTDAYPGIKLLARFANVEERTVQDALKRLELGGHITVRFQGGKVKGIARDKQPNAYAVAMSLEEIAANRAANAVQVETRKAKFSRKPGAVDRTPEESERGEPDRTPIFEPGEVDRTPSDENGVNLTAPGGVKSDAERGAVERTSGVRSTAPKPTPKPTTTNQNHPPTPQTLPNRDRAPSALEGEKKESPEIIAPTTPGARLAPNATFGPRAQLPKPEPRQAIAGDQVSGLEDSSGAAPRPSAAHGQFFAALVTACYGSTVGMTKPVATETHQAARVLEQAGYVPEDVPKIVAWMKARESWRATTTPKTIVERAPAWRNDPSLIAPFNPNAPVRKQPQHRSHSTRADVAFARLSHEMGLDEQDPDEPDPDEYLETDPPQTLALPGGRT